MNEFFARLFELDSFGPGDEGVRFEFAREFPAWAWVLAGVACAAIAGWSYWRLTGSRYSRTALAVVRTILLIAVLVLGAGPQLVRQPERLERDWVVILVDRSRSMTIADVPGPGQRTTREAQLRGSIQAAWPVLDDLAKRRNVLWLGFDGGAYPLRSGTEGPIDLGEPAGRRTAIGRALEQALQQVAARPVSGIVILSDGLSADQPPRTVVRRLESEQIPVFTVPLGSAEPLADLAVARAEAPSVAFVLDVVPVAIEIVSSGEDKGGPLAARVDLVDDATGLVLDSHRLDDPNRPAGQPARLTLASKPDTAGKTTWSVRLVPDAPDLSQENNRAAVSVELVDRPIRVVYFDGYPRWEQRYVKSLLIREKSVRSAVLLVASDKQFIQEGSEPLASIPTSPGDWSPIDVVILGDVRSELFSDEQLKQLKEHVALRGAGLLWIGGPAATPGSYRGRPLADLLPFTLDPGATLGAGSGISVWSEPVNAAPTPAATRLGLLALGETVSDGWPQELSDPSMGWSILRWAQRISAANLKPAAEVLAVALPTTGPAEATPLVVTMRYGAGRVIYVATDETWRWRYGRGETLPERFWLPLLRFLARDSLARSGKPALLEVSPEKALVDQPVRVSLRLLDQSLIESRTAGAPVSASVTRERSRDGTVQAPIALKLSRDSADTFSTTFLAAEPGEYQIELTDSLLAGLGLSARVDIAAPDDELRRPQTDHAALGALADATGGRVLPPDRLGDVAGLLPNRELRILGTPEIQTLWDKTVVLVLVMLLLTVEWLGRKWLSLA